MKTKENRKKILDNKSPILEPRKKTAYLCLGSNLGDRGSNLQTAIQKILSHPKIQLVSSSKVLETKPLEYTDQPDFYNQVVCIATSLEPLELLDYLQSIERELGRVREIPKGPRTIDIDILTYANLSIDHPRLKIPHHSLETRPFVRELLEDC